MESLRGPGTIGVVALAVAAWTSSVFTQGTPLGREVAIAHHLRAGEELRLSLPNLVAKGRELFTANWTDQDGAGRPLSTGVGTRLVDLQRPLVGMRSMNRVSGPDASACLGCHNAPLGIVGGGGDISSVVFQGAERFDFVTFDRKDAMRLRGSVDEAGRPVTLPSVGNQRIPPGLFGAGYLEMLARQITRDLQRTRDALRPGQSAPLVSTGIAFGTLARRADGRWDVSRVEGLPSQSLRSKGALAPPSLVIRPWLQSGTAVSLRDVTNTSLNQHFGIQSTERFGVGTDPDGDGVRNEVTRGDVTALTVFQATLQVPGRVIPRDADRARAVEDGERTFARIGCASCHAPALTLERHGWIYSEPGPINASGYTQPRAARVEVDLTNPSLPRPRLSVSAGNAVIVPAYTDFKLHDISDAADASAREPVDMNQPAGSAAFQAGNRRFLTARLWGVANTPPYFHDGRYTTIRDAIVAHHGEALAARTAFQRLSPAESQSVLSFLDTLQVLPPGEDGPAQ